MCAVDENQKREGKLKKGENMISYSDKGAGRGCVYIKLGCRKKFDQWKRKTEDLSSQQRYKRFLIGQIQV